MSVGGPCRVALCVTCSLVFLKLGDTSVMVTAVSKTKPSPSQFMPLVVSPLNTASLCVWGRPTKRPERSPALRGAVEHISMSIVCVCVCVWREVKEIGG